MFINETISVYIYILGNVAYCYSLGITQHPGNDTFCEGSNAVLSCVVFDNLTETPADTTSWYRDGNILVRLPDTVINNTRDGDLVTSVLTIENVSLNDNGNGYYCEPAGNIESYTGVISVAGEYYKYTMTYKYVRE